MAGRGHFWAGGAVEGDLGFAFIWVQTTDYRLQKQTRNVHYYPCTVPLGDTCCLLSKVPRSNPFFFFFF